MRSANAGMNHLAVGHCVWPTPIAAFIFWAACSLIAACDQIPIAAFLR